jgi:hypothetical protein
MSGELVDGAGTGTSGGLPPGCAAVDDDLGELALGTLAGRGMVAAVAHLESCARCSAKVDELAAAADELLHLAPSAEPPVGFEAGVFERLGLRDKPRRRRPSFGWGYTWRPKVAAAIAAACAVALMTLAFGLGALVGHGAGGGGGDKAVSIATHAAVTETALRSGARTVGGVMVYAGNPTWLFMFMDDPSWQGTLRCEVVMDQGSTVTLGRFWLSDGRGAWAVSVTQPAGRLAQARVVNDKGQVLAKAVFT